MRNSQVLHSTQGLSSHLRDLRHTTRSHRNLPVPVLRLVSPSPAYTAGAQCRRQANKAGKGAARAERRQAASGSSGDTSSTPLLLAASAQDGEQEEDARLLQFIARLPKAELHIHVEGTLEPGGKWRSAVLVRFRLQHAAAGAGVSPSMQLGIPLLPSAIRADDGAGCAQRRLAPFCRCRGGSGGPRPVREPGCEWASEEQLPTSLLAIIWRRSAAGALRTPPAHAVPPCLVTAGLSHPAPRRTSSPCTTPARLCS